MTTLDEAARAAADDWLTGPDEDEHGKKRQLDEVIKRHITPLLEAQDCEIERLHEMTTDSWAAKMQKRADGFEAENRELRASRRELAELLGRFVRACGSAHHKKGEYHSIGEPCPIEAKIDALLSAFEGGEGKR